MKLQFKEDQKNINNYKIPSYSPHKRNTGNRTERKVNCTNKLVIRRCISKPHSSFEMFNFNIKERFPLFKNDDYAYGNELGRGTHSIVKKGVRKSDGLEVAIKIYKKSELGNPRRRNAVFNETEIIRKVSHPNIVSLYDVFELKTELCLVFEYIRGHS